MFVKCFKSKVLFKWQVFLSTQSLQITGKIQGMFAHPTENFVTWTESKVFYQLREKSNWNTHYQHPPLHPFRNKSLVLFIISEDSQAVITPSQQSTKIPRKLSQSYLPPHHGLLPSACLRRRWSIHAVNWSAELQSSRKTWGYFMVLIT